MANSGSGNPLNGIEKVDQITEILSSTPSCLKIISADGKLLNMNRQGLSLIEAKNFEEVENADVYEIVEPSHRQRFIQFNERICSGSKESLIFEIVGLEGTRRWMETYAAPYTLPNGEIAHIAITNDISERVKAEEEYKRQKSIASHQAKLASIGEMAAGVGHEINNPLAIVAGYISVLKGKAHNGEVVAPDELIEITTKMKSATERIAKIVQGLRTFSRTDSKDVVEFSPVVAVNESIEMVSGMFAKDGVSILFDDNSFPEKTEFVGSRGKVQQVLMNLLSNSRDAVVGKPNGKISVGLSGNELGLYIKVEDNGGGIPEDIHERVFDPFFTTKEVNKGTGLGLSIVHTLVQEMNGAVSFTSEPGQGTAFDIFIPASKLERGGELDDSSINKEKIAIAGTALVVDDEPEIQNILRAILEGFGLKTTCCSDGNQAFVEYARHPGKYDLIISDMKMPVMDGISLLKKIRSSQDLAQPKFILVTGGINVDFRDTNSEIHRLSDGYFLKPFDEEAIYQTVVACMGIGQEKVA